MEQKINNVLAKKVWEEIGDWWDAHMVEGDIFHRYLIHPFVLKQLDVQKNDCVIDFACGNGALTRQIAKKASTVVGVDFSSTLLKNARSRSEAEGLKIEYKIADLTNADELSALSQPDSYDKAVCSMALHDIEIIEPLINIANKILRHNGLFVVSIPHPCFNSGTIKFKMPNKEADDYGILRSNYIQPVNFVAHAKEDQPQPHPHFHRPLSVLLNIFFRNNFLLDGCDEPTLDPKILGENANNFFWCHFPEIPPALILRFAKK